MSVNPWCETCGETVHEVLCGKCGKWWVENDLWPGLDHIANFINALDSEGMTASEVRSAIYTECLEPKGIK